MGRTMPRIGVPREVASGETRVAVTPETAGKLARLGFEVAVEAAAGARAHFDDAAYAQAGAAVVPSARELYGSADVVLKVLEPMSSPTGGDEAELLRSGAVVIGFMNPARNADLIARLARGGVTALAMELIPRITRAQKMDALSSMSTVAGYKAALLAADTLSKFFPLLMTAAGTIAPAKVLVLGAGVAGLQAIATARRLGAVVEAFDVRPAVRDEVKSLGATFVGDELVSESAAESSGYARAVGAEHEAKIRELLHKHVAQSDVVIATANVPGRRAPVLVTEAMVRDMRPGSVIVDLAAENGGNCELTQAGKTVTVNGVVLHGPVHLVAALPVHASQMYARNVLALVTHLVKDGKVIIDLGDEITRACCVCHEGRVLFGEAKHAAGATAVPTVP
jgi:H+-translocating NAD(P) transhydrogenase subunit alpha